MCKKSRAVDLDKYIHQQLNSSFVLTARHDHMLANIATDSNNDGRTSTRLDNAKAAWTFSLFRT